MSTYPTPGPWFVRESTCKRHSPGDPECRIGPDVMVRTGEDLPVAQCYGSPHRSLNQAKDNARLIAAAPEMLAFLKLVADYQHAAWSDDAEEQRSAFSMSAWEIIAKIEGREA